MFWLPIAMAAAGAAKHFAVDKPHQKKTAQARAEEMRMQPFTGQAPTTEIAYANPFGSILQGASAGASLQGGLQAMNNNKLFSELALKEAAKGGTAGLVNNYMGGVYGVKG